MEKECLDKSKIITLLKSDFNTKKANTYLICFFVFVVLLEVYAYFHNGADYVRENYLAFPVLLAVGFAVYLIFRFFNYAQVKNVEKCINADNIVVLETKVKRVKTGGGLAEIYFSSKNYGKHSFMADEKTAEETTVDVTRFYLVLTKEKRKFNLALALPSTEWYIGSDLEKYKKCEL